MIFGRLWKKMATEEQDNFLVALGRTRQQQKNKMIFRALMEEQGNRRTTSLFSRSWKNKAIQYNGSTASFLTGSRIPLKREKQQNTIIEQLLPEEQNKKRTQSSFDRS